MADPTPAPAPTTTSPLMESRKFKALLLAIAVYGVPMILTFVLVLVHQAVKDDFIGLAKWMGVSLSPAFLAYIGGTALEDYASKRPPSQQNIQTTGPVDASSASK